jgi:hypothetical protein
LLGNVGAGVAGGGDGDFGDGGSLASVPNEADRPVLQRNEIIEAEAVKVSP